LSISVVLAARIRKGKKEANGRRRRGGGREVMMQSGNCGGEKNVCAMPASGGHTTKNVKM
jgi:hypothetical protein